MSLGQKSVKDVTEADLQALVTNKVREGRTIEFKQTVPGSTDDEKREFLKDVSAFANASGGDLLYGVAEKDGVATSVDGVAATGLDALTLQLQQVERTSIEPRIVGVEIWPVLLANGNALLVVRVPRSWQGPHMVTFKNLSRFYTRTSAGVHQLDVQELRGAFLQSESLAERLRQFRLDRVARIAADETPSPLRGRTRLIVHIIPVGSSSPGSVLDASIAGEALSKLTPMSGISVNRRYNLDGRMVYYLPPEDGTPGGSYTQLWRTGIIEAVDAIYSRTAKPFLPLSYEQQTLAAVGDGLQTIRNLGVGWPIAIALSWLGVRGFRLDLPIEFGGVGDPIDRDDLLLAEVLVEEIGAVDLGTIMKPIFDAVANACGLRSSVQYGTDGKWRARQ